MDQKQNVIYDFSVVNTKQDLAIMPVVLAKKLLQIYAKKLKNATAEYIIKEHVYALNACTSLDEAVDASLCFVQERELIDNITENNWNAYAIVTEPQVVTEPQTRVVIEPRGPYSD